MKKMNNKHGFTLAELLIVVAIIAFMVAIAIPIFTSQLEKARESTDAANIRAAYADVMAKAITDATASTKYVEQRQMAADWQNTSIDFPAEISSKVTDPVDQTSVGTKGWKIECSAEGEITITAQSTAATWNY